MKQTEDPQTLPEWHPLKQRPPFGWLLNRFQASSCDVSPDLWLASSAIKMKHVLQKERNASILFPAVPPSRMAAN